MRSSAADIISFARMRGSARPVTCHRLDSLIFFSCRQQGFIEFDITQIVENWVNGAINYGVMLELQMRQFLGNLLDLLVMRDLRINVLILSLNISLEDMMMMTEN